jgi:hypothetical protein
MKHIFGIAIDKSIDNPGLLRLIDETDGSEIGDAYESEAEAIDAIFVSWPDNDFCG